MVRRALALLFALTVAAPAARADDTPAASPSPSATSTPDDVTADVSLISPVRTYTIQGTYTGASYGPAYSRASQIIQRLAVFYVGKYLMRVTLPRFQTLNSVDSGYGDMQFFYLLDTNVASGRNYVGVFASLPTGTPDIFSFKKWLFGPALAHIFVLKPRRQVTGVLLQTAFSVAGPRAAPAQSTISLLPFTSIYLRNNWFIKTPESPWLFDLARGQTLIALGGGFGKSLKLGEMPCLISITDEATVIHANVPNAPKNILRLTFTFIVVQR